MWGNEKGGLLSRIIDDVGDIEDFGPSIDKTNEGGRHQTIDQKLLHLVGKVSRGEISLAGGIRLFRQSRCSHLSFVIFGG